jgi:hypothetical protein
MEYVRYLIASLQKKEIEPYTRISLNEGMGLKIPR